MATAEQEEEGVAISPSPVTAAITAVTISPSGADLPGTRELQRLADGVASWALIAAMVGIVVGAVLWAFGHYSQNYQQAYNGRRGVIVSALAALLMSGAPTIINFFVHQGHHL